MSGCQKTPARREGVPSPAIISKRRNKEILTQTWNTVKTLYRKVVRTPLILHALMTSASTAAGYFKVPTPEKWHASAGDKQLIISSHLGMYEYDLWDPSRDINQQWVEWDPEEPQRPLMSPIILQTGTSSAATWTATKTSAERCVFVPNSKSRNVNLLCLFNAAFLAGQLHYKRSSPLWAWRCGVTCVKRSTLKLFI